MASRAGQRPYLITLICAVLAAGVVALGLELGPDRIEQWRLAARWTARIGFPIFILAYSASSLARLWPSAITRRLLRERRWWGLGFAATHTIHLAALVTFLRISGETRPLGILLFAGGAYGILFAMALTSNAAAMRRLGRNWKRLHTVGIHWLWLVFFASYLTRTMKPESMMAGYIGTAIALGAAGLRMAAWAKARGSGGGRALPA